MLMHVVIIYQYSESLKRTRDGNTPIILIAIDTSTRAWRRSPLRLSLSLPRAF